MAVFFLVWGSLRQSPAFHDESAYLLQAELLASGRWTAPARPLPEFFDEFHIFSSPRVASKYWPGHSLLMVPGIWLGLPGLVPLLLAGLMGGLVFALAARLGGTLAGGLTWLVWVSAPGVLYFGPTYFSELTTGPLWLLGWVVLLRWKETRRPALLTALSIVCAWGAVTRPLTMIAYVIPVGVVVLRNVLSGARWKSLALALAPALAVLGVIPIWSTHTTGDWRTTPYTLYAHRYLPMDKLGFTYDSTPPEGVHGPDFAAVVEEMREVHRVHTLARAPELLRERMSRIARDMWEGPRVVLVPFALLGLVLFPTQAVLGLVTAGLLVVLHLAYAYTGPWTIYYFELQPVLAFATGLGLARAIRSVGTMAAPFAGKESIVRSALAALAIVLYTVLGSWLFIREVRLARVKHAWLRAPQRELSAMLANVPGPAVVFIRYGPSQNPHLSLITNGPDLDRQRIWKVYDRGADNERLLRCFPERTAYLYDQAQHTLTPLSGITSTFGERRTGDGDRPDASTRNRRAEAGDSPNG
jgi:hypothetical protein